MMRFPILLAAFVFASGLHAAEIELGGRYVRMIAKGDTGELDIATSGGFGANVEVFWFDHVSTRLSATFLNPAAILYPDNPPPSDVDLGTLGIDVYAMTARVHLRPQSRFSFYAGGGAALADVGDLDDQFGDSVAIEFDPEIAFVGELGVRYRILPRLTFEFGVTYMPLEAQGNAQTLTDPRVQIPETLAIDPLLLSAGASWRF
jgi:outer membrane protein W